ncbi:hypothetical protein [Alkalilimnicola ehrlichii]|nr:hypothetical protein [Alkalilimnicola ehrlichii]
MNRQGRFDDGALRRSVLVGTCRCMAFGPVEAVPLICGNNPV